MIQLKIILPFIFLTILNCRAQQCIVALDDFWTIGREYVEENSCYVKDVNNILGKYLGIWKGNYEDKNYEFRITRAIDDKFLSEFKIDVLLIKYIVKDPSGNEIEDTTSLIDEHDMVIWGMWPAKYNDAYTLSYNGRESDCGQTGTVFIYTNGNNVMTLGLGVDRELIDLDECSGEITQILPTNKITLNKQ